MNRRTFLTSAAAASAGTLLRPPSREAALPAAKITRIRFYEAPNVMPLQIPLLQSNMVVTIETDANITGIGEGGTRDTLGAVCRPADREESVPHRALAGRTCIAPSTIRPDASGCTRSALSIWRCGTSRARRWACRFTSCWAG